jgi:hypothetical protein
MRRYVEIAAIAALVIVAVVLLVGAITDDLSSLVP